MEVVENMKHGGWMDQKPMTTFEVAKHCKVTHRTVQQWITSGKLKAYRTPGNHSRIEAKDFSEFLTIYKLPIPKDFVYTHGKKRILIVDDDKTMVQLVGKFINRGNKYEIQHAYDGFMAGKKFVEFKPDLITLDIFMPYLNGDDVLREIRTNSRNSKVKIVVISSASENDKISRIKSLGADEFLRKPLDRKLLVETIERLLEVVA